jgi:aspartyl-tRNA(Asn)/glutamyl-tRNA(Gln) amidotransferase subunit C
MLKSLSSCGEALPSQAIARRTPLGCPKPKNRLVMKVDKEEVEHVANLARIELSEEERELYSEQLSTILEFFDRLKEVDTVDVPPTSHVLEIVNAVRSDELRASLDAEKVLGNAPDRMGRFFRVPKILD